ncbi:MAG: hypothetical protein MUW56_06995 [Chryseobacterium sp.]|uniref:hypothetical protein n=1 Tax=Chryseobacterium sp. TaxID=1871047 RepID=UPI0025BE1B9D|nr:hypothetical protein [Chryseobacterium sp.]MCJ7933379.1 hypothetical protein [Chryseobacterium sp.]
MKTKLSLNARKIERHELKNLKGGIIIRDRVCCAYNEDNYCCEWAIDFRNCRGIQC